MKISHFYKVDVAEDIRGRPISMYKYALAKILNVVSGHAIDSLCAHLAETFDLDRDSVRASMKWWVDHQRGVLVTLSDLVEHGELVMESLRYDEWVWDGRKYGVVDGSYVITLGLVGCPDCNGRGYRISGEKRVECEHCNSSRLF